MKDIKNLLRINESASKARSEWEDQVDQMVEITKYNRGRVLKLLKGIGVSTLRTLLYESEKPEIKNRAAWLQWKINERKGGNKN